jgi:hypothetical protein
MHLLHQKMVHRPLHQVQNRHRVVHLLQDKARDLDQVIIQTVHLHQAVNRKVADNNLNLAKLKLQVIIKPALV